MLSREPQTSESENENMESIFGPPTSSTYKSRNTVFQHGRRNLHLTETNILFICLKFCLSLLMFGLTHITTLPGLAAFKIQ